LAGGSINELRGDNPYYPPRKPEDVLKARYWHEGWSFTREAELTLIEVKEDEPDA
jgi:hypothetical protein